jgi:hypothetical protein
MRTLYATPFARCYAMGLAFVALTAVMPLRLDLAERAGAASAMLGTTPYFDVRPCTKVHYHRANWSYRAYLRIRPGSYGGFTLAACSGRIQLWIATVDITNGTSLRRPFCNFSISLGKP